MAISKCIVCKVSEVEEEGFVCSEGCNANSELDRMTKELDKWKLKNPTPQSTDAEKSEWNDKWGKMSASERLGVYGETKLRVVAGIMGLDGFMNLGKPALLTLLNQHVTLKDFPFNFTTKTKGWVPHKIRV